MADGKTSFVHSGVIPWLDWDRPQVFRSQLLVEDWWSNFLTSLIAVTLTLITPCLFILLRELIFACLGLHTAVPRATPHDDSNAADFEAEDERYNQSHHVQRIRAGIPLAFLESNDVLENVSTLLAGPSQLPVASTGSRWQRMCRGLSAFKARLVDLWKDGGQTLVTAALAILLSVFFLGTAVMGVVSAGIANDGIALSNSPDCGDWHLNPAGLGLGSFNVTLSNGPTYDQEERPSVYKDQCYGPEAKPENCNLFYKQSIDYTITKNAPCPFDGDACSEGPNSAISFDTGLVDISDLGFNVPPDQRLQFRRSMTCAPMHMDDRYIRRGKNSENQDQWEYYYGTNPHSTDPYLWHTLYQPNQLPVPGYVMMSSIYLPWSPIHSWIPPPEFRAGSKAVSLFLILSQEVLHPSERFDPIFPAHRAVSHTTPVELHGWWYNDNTRGTVLGCVDSHQICDASGNTCLSDSELPFEDGRRFFTGKTLAMYNVLAAIMSHSNAHFAVQSRLSAALDAQRKAAGRFSLPLADKQWEVETEAIFQSLLAGYQFGVYDFARGTYAHAPGFVRREVSQPACDAVKIKTVGWKNVTATLFWGILLLALLVLVASRRHGKDRRTREYPGDGARQFFDGQLYGEIGGRLLFRLVTGIASLVGSVAASGWDRLMRGWNRVRRLRHR